MFAIIETGGKQYKVSVGGKLKVEKLSNDGGEVIFDRVLLKSEKEEVSVGTPFLKGVEVLGKILGKGRGERKMVFRYHSKTRYRKKKTHRQPYTEVEIVKIK